MKLIPLSGEKFAIVSDEDYPRVCGVKWHDNGHGYAQRYVRGRRIALHSLISGATNEQHTDHINGNTYDDRRANLRACSNKQNKQGHQSRRGGTSLFRGVSWCNARRAWGAYIKVDGKNKNLGRFKTEMEAAAAYDRAARESFGSFATPNLINRPLTYVATPYTSKDPKESRQRYEQVSQAAALLVRAGMVVFSPISHSVVLHDFGGLAGDWGFWAKQDYAYLDCSQLLVVFTLPGWRESVGVTAEIEYAKKTGIPIEYLDPAHVQEVLNAPAQDYKTPRTTSRYRGVHKAAAYPRKWQAAIKQNGKKRHLGLFEREEDAARAYDVAAKAAFGSVAYINFPADAAT